MLKQVWLVIVCAPCLVSAVCGCANQPRKQVAARRPAPPPPATKPADPGYRVSDMNVQTIRGTTYFYQPTRTTYREIGETAGKILGSVRQAAAENHVALGAPIFVYHNATEEMDKPFDLEIGYPVPDGTQPAGECKVRRLEAFHCATVLFTGPMASLGKAYEKLIPQMLSARLQPADQTREYFLYFEEPGSANNVTQVQVGIKP